MDYKATVTDVLREMDVTVSPEGKLGEIDSLTVVNLVTNLEMRCEKQIPPHALVPETFESVTTIAEMLESTTA